MRKVKGYLCDPAKNPDCSKTCCCFNPDAMHHTCFVTTDPDTAALDEHGRPVPVTIDVRAAREDEAAPRPKKKGFWQTYWPTIVAALAASVVCNWLLQLL